MLLEREVGLLFRVPLKINRLVMSLFLRLVEISTRVMSKFSLVLLMEKLATYCYEVVQAQLVVL